MLSVNTLLVGVWASPGTSRQSWGGTNTEHTIK